MRPKEPRSTVRRRRSSWPSDGVRCLAKAGVPELQPLSADMTFGSVKLTRRHTSRRMNRCLLFEIRILASRRVCKPARHVGERASGTARGF